jgi:hypothetical protein
MRVDSCKRERNEAKELVMMCRLETTPMPKSSVVQGMEDDKNQKKEF